MNPDLLSSTVSTALLALVAALLLAHLSQLAGPHRLRHAVDALICGGLIYLFGTRAFGWAALPREALSAVFILLAICVVALGWAREARGGEAGFPWRVTAAQAAAMAYVFGPLSYWKPAASLFLLFFFALETLRWLAGTEEEATETQLASARPPLFPAKRVRGLREYALAGTAAVLAFVFAMGTGRAPLTPPPESETAAVEAVEEPPAAEAVENPPAEAESAAPGGEAVAQSPAQPEATAPSEAPAATPPESAAPASETLATYTTVAGDTFKTIAKKLYGKPEKWRALAAANPRLKPGAKFKAGVTIKLAEPRPRT